MSASWLVAPGISRTRETSTPAARERRQHGLGDAVVADARDERGAQAEARAGEERRRDLAAREAPVAAHGDLPGEGREARYDRDVVDRALAEADDVERRGAGACGGQRLHVQYSIRYACRLRSTRRT